MNLETSIEQACSKIAPLWPLANFVAVNPYLGFSGQSFSQTAHWIKQMQDAEMTMPLNWYAAKFQQGDISLIDLAHAVEHAPDYVQKAFEDSGEALVVETLVAQLSAPISEGETVYRPRTFSAYLDAREGTHWQHVIREESAKWCAAYYDRGQSTWNLCQQHSKFYEAWLKCAPSDYTLSYAGLKGAHKAFAKAPSDPLSAIRMNLLSLEIPEALTMEWLYRVLLTLPGWAGHLRYLDREKSIRCEHGDNLIQLLAILTHYERALHDAFINDGDCMLGWKRILMEEPTASSGEPMPGDLAHRLLWQAAYEHSIESQLKDAISPRAITQIERARPKIQAAFCIDVRSEQFRRNLETALPQIQTIGFAGFFGVPLSHTPFGLTREEARCPALLAPPVASSEQTSCDHHHPHTTEKSWKQFKDGAASCFSFVETIGLSYAWQLLSSALRLNMRKAQPKSQPHIAASLDMKTKITLAVNILKGLTLTKECAPLVLLCGHGSQTRNNPYASGLDCGACGGHPGDVNARIATSLLNDIEVRAGLIANGLSIPTDTFFIAGLHNTTTDEVALFDLENVPASHQEALHTLQQGLNSAGLWTASTRAKSMESDEADAVENVKARSQDWSQVRPEWGLAGNAGFIVAPRNWTRSTSLNGKAFLHEYDPGADPEGHLLESIMAGPLVVGSWINLQYYASSTDNAHFGSGHKAIHNVVGGLGVALGNENDLRPGLPLQSVHDGKMLAHEPSRLHAMIAAEPERLDAILAKQPALKELLDNEWLHLFALGADGALFSRRKPGGGWELQQMATMHKILQTAQAQYEELRAIN